MIATEMLGPIGNPRYTGYARDILASGRHLLALIEDILDLSRIQAGRIDIDPRRHFTAPDRHRGDFDRLHDGRGGWGGDRA